MTHQAPYDAGYADGFESGKDYARAEVAAELERLRNVCHLISLGHGDSTSAVPEKYWEAVKLARGALEALK